MTRKRIIIGGGVLVALLLAAILLRALLPTGAGFNDANLRPVRTVIPAEANAFPLLLEAGELLAVADTEEKTLSALGAGSSWDEAQAREFLNANAAALEKLRAAWTRPQLQVDTITNFAQKCPYLEEWRQLTSLALIEARLSFHNGNEAEAFEKVMAVIRFGQRVEAAEGASFHYLFGIGFKARGLECLRQFADRTHLPPDRLKSIARQLGDFEANSTNLHASLKVEYVTQLSLLHEFAGNITTNYFGRLTASIPFFDVERSKVELAEQIRRTLIAVTNNYANGVKDLPVAETNHSAIGLLLRGNAMGSILNEMTSSSWEKSLASKCRENVTVRATQTVLALRAFQKTHNRLPQSLAELLPDFLAAIPLDDFDGQPLRYRPEAKIIYSVGADLTDDGGTPPTKQSQRGDLVFKFDFTSPD